MPVRGLLPARVDSAPSPGAAASPLFSLPPPHGPMSLLDTGDEPIRRDMWASIIPLERALRTSSRVLSTGFCAGESLWTTAVDDRPRTGSKQAQPVVSCLQPAQKLIWSSLYDSLPHATHMPPILSTDRSTKV